MQDYPLGTPLPRRHWPKQSCPRLTSRPKSGRLTSSNSRITIPHSDTSTKNSTTANFYQSCVFRELSSRLHTTSTKFCPRANASSYAGHETRSRATALRSSSHSTAVVQSAQNSSTKSKPSTFPVTVTLVVTRTSTVLPSANSGARSSKAATTNGRSKLRPYVSMANSLHTQSQSSTATNIASTTDAWPPSGSTTHPAASWRPHLSHVPSPIRASLCSTG